MRLPLTKNQFLKIFGAYNSELWPSLCVVPIPWSLVGGSAALVLEMTPDLMLFPTAACLLLDFSRRRATPTEDGS